MCNLCAIYRQISLHVLNFKIEFEYSYHLQSMQCRYDPRFLINILFTPPHTPLLQQVNRFKEDEYLPWGLKARSLVIRVVQGQQHLYRLETY